MSRSIRIFLALVVPALAGCGPTTLVDTNSPVLSVAVAQGEVFWAGTANGESTLSRAPVDGGTPKVFARLSVDGVEQLRADAKGVSWVQWSGGAPALVTQRLDEAAPRTLVRDMGSMLARYAVDDENAYWYDYDVRALRMVARTGGSPTSLASLPDGPHVMVSDGRRVFLAGESIVTVPVDGSTPSTRPLAQGTTIQNLAVDQARLFFSDGLQIDALDLSSGRVSSVLAQAENRDIESMVLDGASLYLVVRTDKPRGSGILAGSPDSSWTIERVAATGGSSQLLASGLEQPTPLAQDERALYWGEGRAIRRLLK